MQIHAYFCLKLDKITVQILCVSAMESKEKRVKI